MEKSNQKSGIALSRIKPLAFVVGAAGFLGSFVCEELIKNHIQVLGLDNFETGKKEYLDELSKHKDFHFYNQSIISSHGLDNAGLAAIELPRLDYAFFVADSKERSLFDRGLSNFLAFIKRHSDKKGENDSLKVVLVSDIELYDATSSGYEYLKDAEVTLAKVSKEYKLNARVVRLAPLYGPRMHFRGNDPLIKLIKSSFKGGMQRESSLSDFSTRALFVKDAASLVVKSVLSGGTAQKIFDGAMANPIKLSEVRQILLDPLWHESRGFTPTDLPPWTTPNLERTIRELSWRPSKDLVGQLKETLSYFAKNEPDLSNTETEVEEKKQEDEKPRISDHSSWKNKSLKDVFADREEKIERTKGKKIGKRGVIFLILGLAIIFLGIVWPVMRVGIGLFNIRENLKVSSELITKGEFDQATLKVKDSSDSLKLLVEAEESLAIIRRLNLFPDLFNQYDQLIFLSNEALDGISHAILGAKSLYLATKVISGEDNSEPMPLYESASLELEIAQSKVSGVILELNNPQFLSSIPKVLKVRVEDLNLRFKSFNDLINKALSAARILPNVTAVDGKKSYLVLLQNNLELRPTGGFIGSYAKATFERGRLTKMEVDDIYNLDGNLKELIEPPQEIKSDLGQDRFFLRDSNFDPDFPTSAKVAALFFNKESGEKVNGVFTIDLTASGKLLKAVGGLDLADYSEHVDENNLFEKVVSHSEVGFFPGSQAKKNYLTSLQTELFNKVFFLSKQNWPLIIEALGDSLDQKHILIYLVDPKLLSFASSQNWVGLMPRPRPERVGERADFLAVNESNMGANKANFYLDRKLNLTTTVGREGEVGHRLEITYSNSSPGDSFPGGKYKNRLRVYLPLGTKLNKATFKNADIINTFSTFSDYGRAVYSSLIEVLPKETVNLILEYSLEKPLDLSSGNVDYSLLVVKQPGTEHDSFDWSFNYPINLVSSSSLTQEIKILTDLISDRIFETTLSSK